MASCLTIPVRAQQQFTYTQYIDNLIPVNPAWTLYHKDAVLNLLVRKQWVNVEGAPTTFMANGALPLEQIGASLGFSAMNDKVGPENLTDFNAFFAKEVSFDNDFYLSTSMSIGMRNYNALFSSLGVIDPILNNSDIRENRFNVGASVLMYVTEKFYAGVSVPRINLRLADKDLEQNGNFRNNYFVNIGYAARLGEEFKLETASVLLYTPNVPLQLDLSAKVWVKDTYGLGFNLRSNSEAAFLSTYDFGGYKLGYSYSSTFGKRRVAGFTNATHEITMGISFGRGGYTNAKNQETIRIHKN